MPKANLSTGAVAAHPFAHWSEATNNSNELFKPHSHNPAKLTSLARHPLTRHMFVSSPHHEFRIPHKFAEPGARYWRVMQLSIHLPWFLATFTLGEENDELMHTICVAWDSDLVAMIETTPGMTLRSLLCMTPGWYSADGQWRSREVRSIWRARCANGEQVLVLRDDQGEEFVGSLSGESLDSLTDRQLIVAAKPVRASRRRRA